MKKKMVATVILTVVVLALALTCFSACNAIENAIFNKKVKKAYTQVLADLEVKMSNEMWQFREWDNHEVTAMRFGVPREKDVTLQIFSTGVEKISHGEMHCEAYYNVANQYYYALAEAESQDNIMAFVDALNACFQNMDLIDYNYSHVSQKFEFTPEEAQKFNEIFNLSEHGLKQVGFLPQFVSMAPLEPLEDGNMKAVYTFKGLSFVKTEKGEGCGALPKAGNFIVNPGVDKNDVEIYETDFEMTAVYDPEKYTLGYDSIIYLLEDAFNNRVRVGMEVSNVHLQKSSSIFLCKLQTGDYSFSKQ